ncbi:hypothetical protein [Clostridium sp.]|uniref:hypothetical protein n=1 Tax=Clostridium sp. TaxID=1506 RepID=UPI001DD41A43|nr:hypothetical protein [Clostridium sp.]MBS5307695.1 hypothetical protein [Clostridium sp.]
MSKYLVFDMEDIQKTDYEYEIGEIINVNSNSQYKCMEILTKNNDIYYMFNIGIPKYEYKRITPEEIKNFGKRLK